jgi:hypothetical protein
MKKDKKGVEHYEGHGEGKDELSNGVVIHPYLPTWEPAMREEPVNSRRWTMQERELSLYRLKL